MSKLSQLAGKGKIYNIGGVELEIKPRTMEDVDLVLDITNPQKTGTALKELIRRTLKEAVPDATDEEIAKVGFEHFQELAEAVSDVNNLKKDAKPTNRNS